MDACPTCKHGWDVYEANITHNLNKMAEAAGIYAALWRPDENGFVYAKDIIPALQYGLAKLIANPDEFKKHDSPNGWGTYEQFVPWVQNYLMACEKNPNTTIRVSR
jgi:hypothetical protein